MSEQNMPSDAALAEAAPDLLAALKTLTRAVADQHWTNRPIDPNAVVAGFDAIAKAERQKS